MSDVFQKIISGNDYHQGFAISTANAFGAYSSVSPALNDISDVAAQTGVLDDRFDDKNYYMGSASDAISGNTSAVDNVLLRSDGVGGTTLQSSNFIIPDVYTSSPNDTINHVSIQASGDTANVSLSLVPKGTGAFMLAVPDGTTTGGNVRGANAIDLQTSRTAATQVAGFSQSIAIGARNTSSGSENITIGVGNAITAGYKGTAIGYECGGGVAYSEGVVALGFRSTATGGQDHSAFAQGTYCTATKASTVAIGSHAKADRPSLMARATGRFSSTGDVQFVQFLLKTKTTDATPKRFPAWALNNGTEYDYACEIPSGKILYADILISGIKSDGSAAATYKRKVAIKNVGGTTSLVGSVETIGTDHEDNASTDVAITADDTNDALQINVTGIAAETWRWVAVIEGLEFAYGT